MYTVPPSRLREKAIYGCVAGIRFCTIDCNGDVYPCSFFKDSKYIVGNVLEQDLQEMWLNSNVFKQFREMRGKLKGKCKYCEIQEHCGGCRAIALVCNNDFYAEDEACIKI
ncbi:MAG: SPASM domain-containing protein [Candidatus Helarchaeota archaeon]